MIFLGALRFATFFGPQQFSTFFALTFPFVSDRDSHLLKSKNSIIHVGSKSRFQRFHGFTGLEAAPVLPCYKIASCIISVSHGFTE